LSTQQAWPKLSQDPCRLGIVYHVYRGLETNARLQVDTMWEKQSLKYLVFPEWSPLLDLTIDPKETHPSRYP
jgi:hypothetical protein